MALTKVKLIADGVITSANLDASHGITTSDIGEGSNLYYTDARVSSYLSTNGFATQTDIVAAITDSAPVTLDTLNELAAALGDDPNFATTTATSLGLKAPLASPSFTGNATFAGDVTIGNNASIKSIGSIRIDIDEDNNSTGRAFLVRNDGGTNTLFKIQEDGNVGINRTSIAQPSSGATTLAIQGTSTTKGGSIRLYSSDDSVAAYIYPDNTNGLSINTSTSHPMVFRTAGTEKMRITSGGDVGIGTASPNHLLHLKSTATGATGIIIENTNNAQVLDIDFWSNAGSAQGRIRYEEGPGAFGISPNVGSPNAMYINYSNNVGIGTTSPTQSKLVISGGATGTVGGGDAGITMINKFDNPDNSWSILPVITGVSNTGFSIRDNTDSADRLVIDGSGNVGIGRTDPNAKLDIKGDGGGTGLTFETSDASNNQTFYIMDGGKAGMQYYPFTIGMASGTSHATGARFQVATTGGDFVILNDGKTGIGVTSPMTTLHVQQSNGSYPDDVNNHLVVESSSHSYIGLGGGTSSDVGIHFGDSGSMNQGRIAYQNSDDSLNFSTFQNVRMKITSAGNVGIGTTSPSYKLSVNGSFYSNSVTVNTYSDANSPPAAYVGIGPAAYNAGGMFRLGQVISSSSVNATNIPVVTTYSSGHWGSQPTFFLEFSVSYYRPSYIKYYCQHAVSGTVMDIMDGPNGSQISSTPLSVTVTQLCTNCHGGQPVYKAVWKWSNNGTYLRTAPFITMFGNPASPVYTDGDSSESAIDTLYGGSSTPGHGYLLHSINNTQAAGHPRLSTQT